MLSHLGNERRETARACSAFVRAPALCHVLCLTDVDYAPRSRFPLAKEDAVYNRARSPSVSSLKHFTKLVIGEIIERSPRQRLGNHLKNLV
jgi:hypothetical protein